jgi:tRNA (guanine9-N1)-methyltransferase
MEVEERPSKNSKLACSDGKGAAVVGTDFAGYHEDERAKGERQPKVSGAGEDSGAVDSDMPPGIQQNTELENGSNFPIASSTDAVHGPQLSKNQLKKRNRQEAWEAGREERKARKKQKIHEKKLRVRRERDEHHEATTDSMSTKLVAIRTPAQRPPKSRFTLLPITFVLDCGFDDLMLDKERISLASQITRCYSDNYKAPFQAHITVSSFGGKLKERFETVLASHHRSWKGVHFLEGDFVEAAELAKNSMVVEGGGVLAGAFSPEGGAENNLPNCETREVIYLSSDSPNTLTELKPYSTYIIGGLVDRNRHKGICYRKALDRGIQTAKLPISDYMEMSSRFVLATNHVIEIMLKWLELGDWAGAFLQVMPKRKGGVVKGTKAPEASVETCEDKNEEEGSDVLVEDGQANILSGNGTVTVTDVGVEITENERREEENKKKESNRDGAVLDYT